MRQVLRFSDDRRDTIDKDPALTLDGAGRLWVAWHSHRNEEDRILARFGSGARRGPVVEVSETAGFNFQPRIASEGEDAVRILWAGMRDGRWCILTRSVSSRGPGPVERLAEADRVLAFPAIAADETGRIWAAWCALQDGAHRVVGRCFSGGRWSDPVALSHGDGEHARPVLCGDASGAWAAYQTYADGAYDLYLRRWAPGGPGEPMRFSLTDSWELFPRLCADGAGGVWAAWVVSHDVTNPRGFVDHKVEILASRFDGAGWTPYRSPDRTKPEGYVAHLYDGLLGRRGYMGFLGWRRRPQIVRDTDGDVWVLYERKEEETVNRHGPDALFFARPLTGRGRSRIFEVDQGAYAYTVNGDLPARDGQLPFAGQIPSGKYYGGICAGSLSLGRTRPLRERPASDWRTWTPIRLPEPPVFPDRPAITVGDKTYRLYWGDPHCHGNLSGDAEGEIDENYAYGRHKSRLDFMAVTDNDVLYDNILTPTEWALLQAEAEHADDPDRFVALPAYERTYRKDDGRGPNHRILLFPGPGAPLIHCTDPDADTPEKWAEKARTLDVFSFAHHATWCPPPGENPDGVELCSCWDIYVHLKDTVVRYLRENHRIAFMGNSDSHRIVPGMGGALTGVWAESLTREAILEALRARRCFATNGERILLDVRAAGVPMGSEVETTAPVTLTCRLRSPRPVRRVTFFRDGTPIREDSLNCVDADLTLEDTPEPGTYFYSVEVALEPLPRAPMGGRCGNLQVARGDYAWSTPIWVTT